MIKRITMLVGFVVVLGSAAAATAQWDPNTDPSLIAWWKLDDGAGSTAQDSSGKAHPGTLQGSPQWVAGRFDGALSFNGSNYVQVSYAADLALNEFTVCAWVNVAIEPGVFGIHLALKNVILAQPRRRNNVIVFVDQVNFSGFAQPVAPRAN